MTASLECHDGELGCLTDEGVRSGGCASPRAAVRPLAPGDVEPVLDDRFRLGAVLVAGRPSAIGHVQQAQRLDEGQLGEPEAAAFEHLQGLLCEVHARFPAIVGMR
jgi:hypothetical protein